ncbi:alanine racemase [Ilumatobacter sp.]|uniref:alanine racemase n=1 Tax=Ilumatobacter sp. TaxID=1967498 RepID=UPI003B51B2BA
MVKGNGYGLGRVHLAEIAAEFCDTVAVGTVHELGGLPVDLDVVVLTPALEAPGDGHPHDRTILTVGRREHLDALDGWPGRVIVKLATEMRRYGGDPGLVDEAGARGLDVVGVALHPPPRGTRRGPGAPGRLGARPRRSGDHGLGGATSTPIATPRSPRPTRTGFAAARRCGTATSPRCTSRPTCSTCAPCRSGTPPATARARSTSTGTWS